MRMGVRRMEDHIKALRNMTESSGRIVFFGGAGVSTESGIPDFRSENGIYDAIRRFGERPETLLSHSFFMEHTERFFQYYRSALLVTDVQPNAAHLALSQLERKASLQRWLPRISTACTPGPAAKTYMSSTAAYTETTA